MRSRIRLGFFAASLVCAAVAAWPSGSLAAPALSTPSAAVIGPPRHALYVDGKLAGWASFAGDGAANGAGGSTIVMDALVGPAVPAWIVEMVEKHPAARHSGALLTAETNGTTTERTFENASLVEVFFPTLPAASSAAAAQVIELRLDRPLSPPHAVKSATPPQSPKGTGLSHGWTFTCNACTTKIERLHDVRLTATMVVSHGVGWQSHPHGDSADGGVPTFPAPRAMGMSITLLFDTYESGVAFEQPDITGVASTGDGKNTLRLRGAPHVLVGGGSGADGGAKAPNGK